MKKTAKYIKNCTWGRGEVKLYEVSPPMEYNKPLYEDDPPAKKTNFVVVSAVYAPFSGPETYIFPSDEDGNAIDWAELDGSYEGGLDHERAMQNAGYSIT